MEATLQVRSRAGLSLMVKVAAWVVIYLVLLAGLLVVGRHVTPPDHEQALTPGGGALAAAVHVLTGREGGTDFLLDYASAHALRDDGDPYEILAVLTDRVGTPWPVSHANPHPPTALALVMPFTLVPYESALAAWSLAMVGALIATFRLLGVRLAWAVAAGVGVAVTWPGAYGIGNLAPLIGLGVAVAWRWRHLPAAAGAGIALAAAPKVSGLLLIVPFLLTGRMRAVAWAAVFTGALAAVPLLFDGGVWASYLGTGVEAIDVTRARGDNASLLERGIPGSVMVAALAAAVVALGVRTRDVYWPTVWLMVAALPIAWMYSLLTLIPALVRGLRFPRAVGFAVAATAVAVGSSPSGRWPTIAFGVVVALTYAALWQTRDDTEFPLPSWMVRGWRNARRSGDDVEDLDRVSRITAPLRQWARWTRRRRISPIASDSVGA